MSLQLCRTCMSSFEVPDGAEAPKVCPHCGAELPPGAGGSPSGTGSSGAPAGAGADRGGAPPAARRPTALVFGTPVEDPGGPGPSAFMAGGDARELPASATPPPAAGEESDNCFGLYELISKIGSSDVAVSYRARDRARGRIVALKVLAPGPCGSREEISALRERARAAKRLDHPNIARVLEVGTADGTDYVATEFVEGRALTSFLEGDRLSVGEAVVLGGTLASAIDHAHSEGVVHGDLRPSNVIIDNYGNPRLTDFGFAREYWRVEPDELRRSARSDVPLPQYMAPEQLAGEGPTPRSDVYGLGALIYYMLTGRPPFEGASLFQVVLEMDRGGPTPPGAGIPAPVNAIVMKCLEREPAHRFASAGELALEIDRFLRGERVNAHVPGPGRRLARAAGRRWKTAAAVALLAAASGAGAHYAARSREVARLRGPDHEARVRMADALGVGRTGRWDDAVRLLETIESDGALSGEVRGLASARIGWVHLMAKRPSEAAEAFERALKARPGDAQLHYCYGVALWHAGGEMRQVARALGKSLALDEARRADPCYCYDYGRACVEAGLTDEARAALLQVRCIDPAYRRAYVERHLERLGRHSD